MLFAFFCLDDPDKLDLRLATRVAHLEYIAASGAMVKTAGPLLKDDGETMIGSLCILEAKDRAEAERWVRNDPYSKAGLFRQVELRAFKWNFGAPAGVKTA
jgi:uncharacterized protein YciI